MEKAELRQELQRRRTAAVQSMSHSAALEWDSATASRIVDAAARITDSFGVVASYSSLPSEPPTRAVNARLVANGSQVWLPGHLTRHGEERRSLRWTADGKSRSSAHVAHRANLVIVPALALTPDGQRLGKGKGYYDRFLQNVRHLNPMALVIGVIRESELIEELPLEPHDRPVDLVVTVPNRILE